jgi:medium-chain acyl-[acyl-carrier-protein] hydrolase
MMQQTGPGAVDARTKWVIVPAANPAASLRLFCFASAGHGPAMFRSWLPLVGRDIELGLVHLPGRESRWAEAPLEQLDALVPHLVEALAPAARAPFAVFGHSLGALVAFEVVRGLRARAGVEPRHVIASAHRAPHTPLRHARLAHLAPANFIAEVNARHGGIPPDVAANQELMDLMLPSLRADYKVFEEYQYRDGAPLSCPVTAFGGTRDPHVTREDLDAWRSQTTGPFALRMFDGGHFFVNDHRPLVVSTLVDVLKGRV